MQKNSQLNGRIILYIVFDKRPSRGKLDTPTLVGIRVVNWKLDANNIYFSTVNLITIN